jgi:dipeptidyl aminopeptidase/acylaminoacyl peptidase
MKRLFAFSFLVLFSFSGLAAQNQRALTFEEFIAVRSLSDSQIAPDGKSVAFVVTEHQLAENRGNSDIWLARLDTGEVRRLTWSPMGDGQPRWSPDGRMLAFVSARSGQPQIYVMLADGGEASRVSNLEQPIANLTWSPDGRWLYFSSDIEWPPVAEAEMDPYPTSAMVWDRLYYRHWDSWRVRTRSHLFRIPAGGGEAVNITPIDQDIPTLALAAGPAISFTPDGSQIVFVMNAQADTAAGTNNDLYLMDAGGGELRNLTASNPANDHNPRFSPDGRWLAYLAHARPGFEADRNRIILRDWAGGDIRDLTPDWALSVGDFVWADDGKALYALVDEEARNVIYRISIPDGARQKIFGTGRVQALSADASSVIFTQDTSARPTELFRLDPATGESRQITRLNADAIASVKMNDIEDFWFAGARGQKVHGLLLRPPFFEPGRKYPLVYLIHGGPQGAWQDSFHPRWNYQMFASPGYVVAMVNFHGSTGYGQEFTDSISRNWGGYPYEDLMKGVDYLLENYDYIDSSRLAAAGASYGGYMINWIATRTDRFRCLINHDGVFNMESMYGTTEELWFPEWEFGGPPWENRALYRKWSPHEYAENLRTPMLVIHGQLDYRVDLGQGLEVFTSLRRQGVPARFLYFPDEGHWVLKPRNRRVWWREMLGWLQTHIGQASSLAEAGSP